jgi:hypothetical protein
MRGLIVISIHQTMLEVQMDEFFLEARDQLDD